MKPQNKRIVGLLWIFLVSVALPGSDYALGHLASEVSSATQAPDIFPFPVENDPSASSVSDHYTERLYDVTDEGVRDPDGNLIQPSSSPAPSPSTGGSNPTSGNTPLDDYQASILAHWGGKRAYTQQRLDDLKASLQSEIGHFESVDKKIRHFQKALEPVEGVIEDLNAQTDLLNLQINTSNAKIQAVEFQIAEKQLKLKDLLYDLETSRAELEAQKKVAMDYILMVYRENEKFRTPFADRPSMFRLLLADSSVSETLLSQEYMNVLATSGRQVFYDLHAKTLALQEKGDAVQKEQAALDALNISLNEERKILEEGRQSKQELLAQTQGQQQKYQELIEQSNQEAVQSAIEIQNMKDNIEFIGEKLKILDDSLSQASAPNPPPADPALGDTSDTVVPSTPAIPEPPARLHPLSWPVPPLAVSTYFEDPTYPKKWGIHKAVDLRAKQFTPIRAPANAYVFQAKDNGKGYSYIILAHKGKLVTVYGHVTQILVKAGQMVKEGDVIGLSGGTPGTKGAGLQTTGPHLHFEVWHDGKPANPLDYLPVEQLPLEYIPETYLKEFSIQKP